MLTLATALQDAIDDEGPLSDTLLVSLGRFGDTILRRTTWHHNLTWNSVTWTSDALLVSVDTIPQASRYAAVASRIVLSGIDPMSQEPFERQPCEVYLAFVKAGAVVGNALLLFSGTMAVSEIEESVGEVTQPIDVEVIWNRGSRVVAHSRTDEAQTNRFSGDRAFRDVTKIREITLGGTGVHVYR